MQLKVHTPPMEESGFYVGLGRAVSEMRGKAGLTRKQLAIRAGVSYPYLSEIENGKKRLSARALLLVSRALGVRPYQLLESAEAFEGSDNGITKEGDEGELRLEVQRSVDELSAEDLTIVLALLSRLSGKR